MMKIYITYVGGSLVDVNVTMHMYLCLDFFFFVKKMCLDFISNITIKYVV